MKSILMDQESKEEKPPLSELLAAPPTDDVLLELFSYSRGGRPYITQSELEIMNLRLSGLTAQEAGEKLNLTMGQVNGRFQSIKAKLLSDLILNYVEIDVPGIRRLRGMDIPISSGYTKVSELLQDMPSDQELLEIFRAHGHIAGITGRRTLSNDDLSLLQSKADGRRDIDIARERGVSRDNIRRRLVWIRYVLRQKMGIQIDRPELFPHEAAQSGPE